MPSKPFKMPYQAILSAETGRGGTHIYDTHPSPTYRGKTLKSWGEQNPVDGHKAGRWRRLYSISGLSRPEQDSYLSLKWLDFSHLPTKLLSSLAYSEHNSKSVHPVKTSQTLNHQKRPFHALINDNPMSLYRLLWEALDIENVLPSTSFCLEGNMHVSCSNREILGLGGRRKLLMYKIVEYLLK